MMNHSTVNNTTIKLPSSYFGVSRKYLYLKLYFFVLTFIIHRLGYTTNKKTSFLVKKIINFIFCIHNWIFSLIKVPELKKINKNTINYVQFKNSNYYNIKVRHESRPSILALPSEEIVAEIVINENAVFKVGVSLLQTLDYRLLKTDCIITTKVNVLESNQTLSKSFRFPVRGNNKNIFYNLNGCWIDYWYDLSKFEGKRIHISLSAKFEKNGKTISSSKIPSIAWGTPKLVQTERSDSCSNIILLSFESMADTMVLNKNDSVRIETPALDELANLGTRFTRAYSSNETTLGSIGSFFTGLFPSLHGMVDYDDNSYRLNGKIKTLAEILRDNGFSTHAVTELNRMEPWRWSRGFDSYLNVPYRSDNEPDSGYINRLLDGQKYGKCFLFAHLDWLHAPIIRFNHTRVPRSYNIDLLEEASKDKVTRNLYYEQIKYLDNQVGEITAYLKRTNQFKNSMIIITGDHGSDLPPWGNHNAYALYDQRTRVPFIIKWPDNKNRLPKIVETPTTVSTEILPLILSTNNIPLPDYLKSAPIIKDHAVSESLTFPGKKDYVVSMVSDKYKYVLFAKITNSMNESIEIIKEKLFMVNAANGVVDDKINIADDHFDIVKQMRAKCSKFIGQNKSFKKYHLI
jgi:hypothetical protein